MAHRPQSQPPPTELKALLDEAADRWNRPAFIEADPIAIPHRYSHPADQEVAAFWAATLAWGRRDVLLRNLAELMRRMDEAPYAFVMDASRDEQRPLAGFVHRTFNGVDAAWFVQTLRRLYRHHGGLQGVLAAMPPNTPHVGPGLQNLHNHFFAPLYHPSRTRKHLPNVGAGAAAKRLNMFLRWMVRQDRRGVDLGLWTRIAPSQLLPPLDVHAARTARELGLLARTQNDFRSVLELAQALKNLDPIDPIRYDFALFGLSLESRPSTRR